MSDVQTTDRAHAARGFLDASGWRGASIAPLAGDASFRRYARVTRPGATAMLMDADPATGEDVRPFLRVTALLRGAGFGAPMVLAADEAQGFLLLEDLGDALFARVLAETGDPGLEETLYAAAVDVLAALHTARAPGPDALAAARLPPYDDARLAAEAGLLLDWYMPAATGAPVPAGAVEEWRAVWAELLAFVRVGTDVVCLRDYHAENLIWQPARAGLDRVRLIDYQDAVTGPAAYDLVSLVEDARRDLAPGLGDVMIARYLDAAGVADREAFLTSYAVLGAQRNAKIVGIFARLWKRDGKPRYLGLLPRVFGHLAHDLAHPALAPLAHWFARWLPRERWARDVAYLKETAK